MKSSLYLSIVVLGCTAAGCNFQQGQQGTGPAVVQENDMSAKVLSQVQGRFFSQNGALRIKGGNYQLDVTQNSPSASTPTTCEMLYQGSVQFLSDKHLGKVSQKIRFKVANVQDAQIIQSTGDASACTALQKQAVAQGFVDASLDEQDSSHLKFNLNSDKGPYVDNWVKNGRAVDKTEDFLNQSATFEEMNADRSLSSDTTLSVNSISGVLTYKNPACGMQFNVNVSKVVLQDGKQLIMAKDVEQVELATPATIPADCDQIKAAWEKATTTGTAIKLITTSTGTAFQIEY